MTALFGVGKNAELQITEDVRAITAVAEMPVVSYADVLDKATPSVVAVYSSQIIQSSYYQRAPQGIQDLFRQWGRPLPAERSRSERASRASRGGLRSDYFRGWLHRDKSSCGASTPWQSRR